MRSLLEAIPNVDVMVALQPEELAAKVLFLLQEEARHSSGFVRVSYITDNITTIINEHPIPGRETPKYDQRLYPKERVSEVVQCIREAWGWLVAQGLLVSTGISIGPSGNFYVLSRRARHFVDETKFVDYATSRLLQPEMLHQQIAGAAWQSFMRGDYSTSVFQAMRQVEIAVREAAGFAQGEHGVPMIRRAFHKDNGPLTDPSSQDAEKEALSNLFAGAIGSYKNPHSHRNVPLENPREAAEIVMLASHLLRIVDARVAAKEARDDL